jgi:hypothetical protein
MEIQVEGLVRTLPYGRRVMASIDAPSELRFDFIQHIVDRACTKGVFPIPITRLHPDSFGFERVKALLVTDSVDDSMAMQDGVYTVCEQDLPANEIYQCDNSNGMKRRE